LLDSARAVLEEAGESLRIDELMRRLLDRRLWHSKVKTPAARDDRDRWPQEITRATKAVHREGAGEPA
jgi:hypothetical protein